jgi:hypothetical protein
VHTRLILSLALISVGLLLLGSGLTGMVTVSQSCCFGPDCAAENACTALGPSTQSPAASSSSWSIAAGALLVAGGLFYISRNVR